MGKLIGGLVLGALLVSGSASAAERWIPKCTTMDPMMADSVEQGLKGICHDWSEEVCLDANDVAIPVITCFDWGSDTQDYARFYSFEQVNTLMVFSY